MCVCVCVLHTYTCIYHICMKIEYLLSCDMTQ